MASILDGIAKQKLYIFLIVDTSTSMRGKRIKQVNEAISDISNYLNNFEGENTNVEFHLVILTFGTNSEWFFDTISKPIKGLVVNPIKAGGYSNLHLAYNKLNEVLLKESQGGIMPDFGGIAPIMLLLTDGHPTKYPINEELETLRNRPWFKVALRYGIAIELNDNKTISVLRDFVQNNGDVIDCYNSNLLKKIIKVIVITASKVKSDGSSIHRDNKVSASRHIQIQVQQALTEVEDWEW